MIVNPSFLSFTMKFIIFKTSSIFKAFAVEFSINGLDLIIHHIPIIIRPITHNILARSIHFPFFEEPNNDVSIFQIQMSISIRLLILH